MTQDITYFESGYIDEHYFVYTADAQSNQSVTASVTANVGVIKASAVISMAASFTVSSSIHDIKGIQLTAFSNASLTAQASRIRNNNIAVSAVFNVATSASRVVHVGSSEAAAFTFSLAPRATKTLQAAYSAAFSLAATGVRINRTTGDSVVQGQIIAPSGTILQTAQYPNYSRLARSFVVENNATIEISNTGQFSNSLRFTARDSGHGLSHGPVYGSSGYLALRNNPDTTIDNSIHVLMSSDGVTWNEVSHNIDITASDLISKGDIAYINGKYVIFTVISVYTTVTRYYIKINTSSDGISWNSYTSNTNVSITDPDVINYQNGLWHVFGQGNLTSRTFSSYSSSNLTTWTNRILYQPSTTGVTYNQQRFTDIATDGSNIILIGYYNSTDSNGTADETLYWTSSNNSTWSNYSSIQGSLQAGGTSDGWQPTGIAYGNNVWVVVGTGGKIYWTTDRTTWISATSHTTGSLYSIRYANGIFIVNGTDTILTSTNGITWTTRSIPVVQYDDIYYASNGVANSSKTKPIYVAGKWIVSHYQSTDNGVTWTLLDYQIPGKQPFIKYPYKAGWNTWKSMDFWAYIPYIPYEFTEYGIASERESWTVYLESTATGALSINYRGPNFTNQSNATITSDFNYGQWNHFRLITNGTTASWYLNGTRKVTTTTGTRTAGSDTLNIGLTAWVAENQRARSTEYYIDEFYLTDELLNATSVTTITVPTEPWHNTEVTDVLLHFDTNFEDDTSTPVRLGTAALTSLFSVAVITSDTRHAAAVLTSTATLSANAIKASSVSASLSSAFTQIVNTRRTRNVSASLTAFASELTTNVRTRGFGVILTSTATLSSTPTKTIGPITASLSSRASLSANLVRVVNATAALSAFASTLTVNVRIRTNTISLSSNATLTASGNVTRRLSSAMITPTFTQVTTITRVRNYSASWTAFATELVVNTKKAGLFASLSSTASLSAAFRATRRTNAALTSQASLTVNPLYLKVLRVNAVSRATLTAVIGKRVSASAALQVTAFELVIGDTINLTNTDIWIVPPDDTVWTIQAESNEWIVPFEDRSIKIIG
jgi:hypothetical protein